MDADRLCENPGTKTEDSILLNAKTGTRVSAFFVPVSKALLHSDWHKESQTVPIFTVGCVKEEEPWAEETWVFYKEQEEFLSLAPKGDTVSWNRLQGENKKQNKKNSN